MIQSVKKIQDTVKSQLKLEDAYFSRDLETMTCIDKYGSFIVPLREKESKFTKAQIKKYSKLAFRAINATNRINYIKHVITSRSILPRHIRMSEDCKTLINNSETLAGIDIEIFCNGKHKYFSVNLLSVLMGRPIQCPKCLKEQNDTSGPEQLYIINIVNLQDESEEFTKIGIAGNMNTRYPKGIAHEGLYKVKEVVMQYEFPSRRAALDAENALHTQFKDYSYTPERFAGHTECFFSTILEDEDFNHAVQKYKDLQVENHKF